MIGVYILIGLLVVGSFFLLYIRWKNKNQHQHSILRQYPLLGKIRYAFEMIGPELRQYITDSDLEGKPISRYIFQHIVFLGKYANNLIGFGSRRDFDAPGYYLRNAIFGVPFEKVKTEKDSFSSKVYKITDEGVFSRKEKQIDISIPQYTLQDPLMIGANDDEITHVWENKSFVGMSAMSYGSLGSHAVQTLSHGLGISQSYVNTGEGGLADLHLVGGGDVVYQFGPAMFGCRTDEGTFSPEKYTAVTNNAQVVATEIKLHQGAKVKGGILPKEKISEDIAKTRGIRLGEDCLSPNVYPHISNPVELASFIRQLKRLSKKPVGIKIVVGQEQQLRDLFMCLTKENALPNFVTIDGSEGGTGATPQDMADSLGLPILDALSLADTLFRMIGIRDRMHVFAAGKLHTPDKVCVALALGADCVNIARGLMIQLGCIQALKCHTNHCPVGVATQDQELQNGLVITEKKYRVANYIATMRKKCYALAAACGLHSPTEFSMKHVYYKKGLLKKPDSHYCRVFMLE